MVHTGKALPVSQIIPRGTASGACFRIKQPNWVPYSLTGREAMDSKKVKCLIKTVLFCFFLESRQLISISSFSFFLFFFFFFLSEMLADKLAKAPDLFVIPADTRDEKVCLVIFVWPLLDEK